MWANTATSWSSVSALVLQVELFAKDIEYIRTELNHVSSTDTSPISLYEQFHISPIKVGKIQKYFLQM